MDLWFVMQERFEDMTKDELLNRLVSLELSKLTLTHGKDLNWTDGARGGGSKPRRNDRSPRSSTPFRKNKPKKKFGNRSAFRPSDDGDPRFSRSAGSSPGRRPKPHGKRREDEPFKKFKKKKKGGS